MNATPGATTTLSLKPTVRLRAADILFLSDGAVLEYLDQVWDGQYKLRFRRLVDHQILCLTPAQARCMIDGVPAEPTKSD